MYFRFIDHIASITAEGICGQKTLQGDEAVFRDHFVGHPMLPAAMMMECGCRLLTYWMWHHSRFTQTLIPSAFRRFAFHRTVTPGDTLSLEVIPDLLNKEARVQGTCGGLPVFEGTLSFTAYPLEDFNRPDQARAELAILCSKDNLL